MSKYELQDGKKLMQNSSKMRKSIEEFHGCIKILSNGLSDVSGIWQDEKYREISHAFTDVANNSKSVIESGSKCCGTLDKFISIANEKY